ncbi:LOW QUALITY PROTEIN: acylamino-acid-releasing enzyme-like [Sylvia borin]
MGHGKGDCGRALWGAAGGLAPAGALAPGCSRVLWQASHCERQAPTAQPGRENSPMATGTGKGVQMCEGVRGTPWVRTASFRAVGTDRGVSLPPSSHAPSLIQAAHSPAACYRELSRFPAVTRATLSAAARGLTFLLHTGSSAGTRPRGSAAPCSNAARGRATSCWGCGTVGYAVTAWIPRRWGSMGTSTRRAWWLPGARLCLYQAGHCHPPAMPGPFACLAWSHSETLLYVAEKSRPKRQSPCPWDVPEAAWPAAEGENGEAVPQFVYHEDWGEALSTRSVTVLCILDLEGLSLSVLEGVPEHLSPDQALWSPDDHGAGFVGSWNKPLHLELLSAENASVCSPWLSPDGQRLLYRGGSGGTHWHCLHLRMLTWQTRQTVMVLDVVQEPMEAFAGLYAEVLLPRCWAADSRRAVLGTPQQSRTDPLLMDMEASTVANLTADTAPVTHGSPEGCWELFTLQWDLWVATCSAPHHPPQPVVAVLPPAGQDLPLAWMPVEDAPTLPGVTWKTLMVQPLCSWQGPTAQDTQAFEALLLSPSNGTPLHPLIVCPHGDGPHAVFDARWHPSMAALCQLGFTMLLVNYCGSLGFGQASISSLLSLLGKQDVADTQVAVEQVLHREPLDPHRLGLLAGSHGAFIALHLLTHELELYQACALHNPVSNLPALLGTSDIPDATPHPVPCHAMSLSHLPMSLCHRRYTSLGLPYSFERVPHAEEVATMLLRLPISQAAQVQTLVLLCMGARDQRVSPTEALELYRVLRARDVPARLLWYPEGGHTLAGVETEANVFKNCAHWLLQHLGQPSQDRTGWHSP